MLADTNQAQGGGTRMELISFQIREQAFCVDLMAIREIRSRTRQSGS